MRRIDPPTLASIPCEMSLDPTEPVNGEGQTPPKTRLGSALSGSTGPSSQACCLVVHPAIRRNRRAWVVGRLEHDESSASTIHRLASTDEDRRDGLCEGPRTQSPRGRSTGPRSRCESDVPGVGWNVSRGTRSLVRPFSDAMEPGGPLPTKPGPGGRSAHHSPCTFPAPGRRGRMVPSTALNPRSTERGSPLTHASLEAPDPPASPSFEGRSVLDRISRSSLRSSRRRRCRE